MNATISEPVRLGIVGCGAITEAAHLPAALSLPSVEVTALCDPNGAQLRRLQMEFGLGPILYEDYRRAFDEVDAVVLALPNALHAPAGLEFLSRGISVLCEKPLAITGSECRQLCHEASLRSATLAVGFVTRFFPSVMLTKTLIQEGFLGAVKSFEYEFGTADNWAPASGYNLARASAGGGVLVTSGSHFLDRMLYLFDDVEVIRYYDDNRGGVEANCMASFAATVAGSPVRGTITLSKTHLLKQRLRIVGESGALELGERQTGTVTYYPHDRGLRHEISPAGAPDCANNPNYFSVQLEDFVSAVKAGTPPRVDGEQAMKSVVLTERCYEIRQPLEEKWCEATMSRLRAACPTASISPEAATAI